MLLIGYAIAESCGYHIDHWSVAPETLIITGLGLFAAKDARSGGE